MDTHRMRNANTDEKSNASVKNKSHNHEMENHLYICIVGMRIQNY